MDTDPVPAALADMPAWVISLVALAPLGPPLVAVAAVAIAWWTLRQRSKSDDRQHWWARTQWAIERVEDERRSERRRAEEATRRAAEDAARPWWRRRLDRDVGGSGDAVEQVSVAFGILSAQLESTLARKDDKAVVGEVSEWILGPDRIEGTSLDAGRGDAGE